MVRTAVILATGAWKAGREQRALTPDPGDWVDPLNPWDPRMSSKSDIFIVKVDILSLDGAPV